MNGAVRHFEIPADDVDRAKAFYREAFGWTFNDMPEMAYSLVATAPGDEGGPHERGVINGGMLARQAPITAPVVTLEVDDMAQALETVEKLGGRTAVPSQPVGDMGFAAYITDTEGNVIGLWQNAGTR